MCAQRYHDMAFDDELLSASWSDGTQVHFTRSERAVLRCFVQHPGRLLTREQLLAALASDASASDRTVDFLVNRLRVRLRDSARKPRFIATRYGEGYIWIAPREARDVGRPFLVVGPVWNLDGGGALAADFLAQLHRQLALGLGEGHRVVVIPQWRPGQDGETSGPYSLGLGMHGVGSQLHMAVVLRHHPSNRTVHTQRVTLTAEGAVSHEASLLAAAIRSALWLHRAMPPGPALSPTEAPLQVRIHEAAQMLARRPDTWRENTEHLQRMRDQAPADPGLSVLWALNRYYELVFHASQASVLAWDDWERIEDEIEATVMRHLPGVQRNPLMVLAAAKLLLFVDRGHLARVEHLVDETFLRSTAFAATFALQGQVRMSRGFIEEALQLFAQGLALCEERSDFWCYLTVLRCSALLADGRYRELAAAARALYDLRPEARLLLGLMFAEPGGEPDDAVRVMLGSLDAAYAQGLVRCLYRITARHFRLPRHRRQVMAGLLALLEPRFGPNVVEPAVAAGLAWPGEPGEALGDITG